MIALKYLAALLLLIAISNSNQAIAPESPAWPLIRLCCKLGYSYYPHNSCRPVRLPFTPRLPVHDTLTQHTRPRLEILHVFDYLIGQPNCSSNLVAVPAQSQWLLRSDGTVWYQDELELDQSVYCATAHPTNVSRDSMVTLYACDELLRPRERPVPYMTYCMLASVPFLVATFAVYAWLPDLRTLHGQSLMCYLIGLAGTFVGMALVQLDYSGKSRVCSVLGPLTYFLIMFTFLWLNVISFDVWWNFRGSGKLRAFSRREQRKKFVLFSAYAWLTPLGMVGVSVLADLWSDAVPEWLQPGFSRMAASGSCFLKNDKISKFLYLYLPIVSIMTCNATFFLLTARQIRRVQAEIGAVVGAAESGRHQQAAASKKQSAAAVEQQEQFALFARLYIIMGVTWVLDVVSWSLDAEFAFRPSDVCNTLQGPIVFGLFVLKPNVRRMLVKRCNWWRRLLLQLRGSWRTKSTSTTTTTSCA